MSHTMLGAFFDISAMNGGRIVMVEKSEMAIMKRRELCRASKLGLVSRARATCLADGLACALAVHLLRRYSPSGPQAPHSPAEGGLPGWRLRRVVEHMHANMAQKMPLAQLAAVGGLSTSQFTRAFRAATRESPYQYLVRIRIERACDLLEHTVLPIVEVGLRCGFEQPNHFATMFRKFMGMSPRAYRKARCT